MADNKQYISQVQDNGTVMISEDVVASIATQALKEVEGVMSVATKPAADLVDMIGKKLTKGLKITIDEDNAVAIDVAVVIGYGQSVVNVAQAVQSSIVNAVQSMTGVQNVSVNVNVCGITRQ